MASFDGKNITEASGSLTLKKTKMDLMVDTKPVPGTMVQTPEAKNTSKYYLGAFFNNKIFNDNQIPIYAFFLKSSISSST